MNRHVNGVPLHIKVRNYTPPGKKATREYTQTIDSISSLGKEIKISPKAAVTINSPGFKIEMIDKSISVNVSIGDNYTADLVMTTEAWEALKNGDKIYCTSVKDLKKTIFDE